MIPCMWFTCSLNIIFIPDLVRHSTAQFPRQITPWLPTRPMSFLLIAVAKCIITAKVRALFFFSLSSDIYQKYTGLLFESYTSHFWKCLFCFLFSSVTTLFINIWHKFKKKKPPHLICTCFVPEFNRDPINSFVL